MDWSRAKTILIIALIITNAFLFYTYTREHKDSESEIDEASLIKVLESAGVELDTEIPKLHPEMAALSVEYGGASEPELSESLLRLSVDPFEATDGAYAKQCEDIMEAYGINIQYAALDKFERKIRGEKEYVTISYRCEVDSVVLDEASFSCRFKDGRAENIEYRWINPVGRGRARAETVSAASALLDFRVENAVEDSGKIRIKDIELVYWVNREDYYDADHATMDTALPAWKVVWENEAGEENVWHGIAPEQESLEA